MTIPSIPSILSNRRGRPESDRPEPIPNVTPLNAIAVTPGAWDARPAKRRQRDRLEGIQRHVLKIIGSLEKNQRAGRSADNLDPIVAEWAGPLAKYVTVSVRTVGGGFRPRPGMGHRDRKVAPTKHILQLHVANRAVAMELRPRVPALLARLKENGITEIKL